MPRNDNSFDMSRRAFSLTAAGFVGVGSTSVVRARGSPPPADGLKATADSPLPAEAIEGLRQQFVARHDLDEEYVVLANDPVPESGKVVAYAITMKDGSPFEYYKELPEWVDQPTAKSKVDQAHRRVDEIRQRAQSNVAGAFGSPAAARRTSASATSDGGAVSWERSYQLENETHRDRSVYYDDDNAPEWCGDIEGDNYLLSVPESDQDEWAVDFQVDVWPQVNENDEENDWDTDSSWKNWDTWVSTNWDESDFPLEDVVDMAPVRERKEELDYSIQFTASNSVGGGVTIDPQSPYIKVDPENSRDEYVRTNYQYPYDCCKSIGRYEHCVLGQDSVAILNFDEGGPYGSSIVGCDVEHTFQYVERDDHYDAQTGEINIGWDIRQT